MRSVKMTMTGFTHARTRTVSSNIVVRVLSLVLVLSQTSSSDLRTIVEYN